MVRTSLCVSSLALFGLLSAALSADPNSYVGLAGPPGNTWDLDANWSADALPNETHDVTVATSNATIQMNYNPPGNYSVLSFSPSVSGTLEFVGTDRNLNVLSDSNNEGALNAYTIAVSGPSRRFTAGSPFLVDDDPITFDPNVADVSVANFNFSAPTGSVLAITGIWGPGRVTVTPPTSPPLTAKATICVGHSAPTPDHAGAHPIPGMRGTIDSGVIGFATGASRWTLGGVKLYANQAKNLDEWVINDPLGVSSELTFREFLEVRKLTCTSESGSYIKVYDPTATADDVTGLRIKSSLRLSRTGPLYGPYLETEGLVVDPKGTLTLEHGSRFGVFIPVNGHSHAPTRADFMGTEDTPSILSYGFVFRDNPNNPDSDFRVDDRGTTAHLPTLNFLGQSYITTVSDPDIVTTQGEIQELDMRLSNHFDINATTHVVPARHWFTGHVDQIYHPSHVGNDRTASQQEAIAGDCCNVFFTDVNEPRCLKYWRSLWLKDPGFPAIRHVFLELVDKRDNYPPSPVPEAVYFRDKVLAGVENDFECGSLDRFAEIRLRDGVRLYYGQLDPADGSTVCGGEHHKLIKTIYGDFDGDCDVDNRDYTVLRGYATSSGPGIPTSYPIADFDGDCDIDLQDINGFRVRLGRTCTCVGCNPPACGGTPLCPALDCPTGVGPGESQFGLTMDVSPEEDAVRIGQMLLEYLTGEELPAAPDVSDMNAEETEAASVEYDAQLQSYMGNCASTVLEMSTWLDMHLSISEKAILVAQLSNAATDVPMPNAGANVAQAVAILSD